MVATQIQTSVSNALRTLAKKMQREIDDKLAPRQTNTRKRLEQAEVAHREGAKLQRVQQILNVLADQHEQGTIAPILAPIKTRAVLDNLISHVLKFNATQEELKALGYDPYITSPVTQKTLQTTIFDISSGYYLPLREQLKKIGITEIEKLCELLVALKAIVQPSEADFQAERLRKLERELALKKFPGYFPTPPGLAAEMVRRVNPQPHEEMLEPEAGKANLCIAALDWEPTLKITVCEWQKELREYLELKGYKIGGHDFLDFAPQHLEQYQMVIMNPPFEKNQDAIHIQAAYGCLKPGGRMVAIAGEGIFCRNDKIATGFRAWLQSVDGKDEKLPDNSFANAERSTGVACRIVEIRKPGSPATSLQPAQESEPVPVTVETVIQDEPPAPEPVSDPVVPVGSKTRSAKKPTLPAKPASGVKRSQQQITQPWTYKGCTYWVNGQVPTQTKEKGSYYYMIQQKGEKPVESEETFVDVVICSQTARKAIDELVGVLI